jgi:soluble lytic murein transglycosylase-like protein
MKHLLIATGVCLLAGSTAADATLRPARTPDSALATCVNSAATTYGINPALLRSIVKVESGWNPHAIARNSDGSVDIGPMQVNSRWLPSLAARGVSAKDLADPCNNVYVGTWILANLFRHHGVTWDAVGRYNAATKSKRTRYAWLVHGALHAPLAKGK